MSGWITDSDGSHRRPVEQPTLSVGHRCRKSSRKTKASSGGRNKKSNEINEWRPVSCTVDSRTSKEYKKAKVYKNVLYV